MLGGEGDNVEVHRFGHWGPGWYEIIIVRPGSKAEVKGREIEDSLEGYPILNENDFCEREQEAAQETWKHCYSVRDRVAYIRKNRSDFEFKCFSDMLGCVRGNFFAGSASELIT
jgi:hypothetical protein